MCTNGSHPHFQCFERGLNPGNIFIHQYHIICFKTTIDFYPHVLYRQKDRLAFLIIYVFEQYSHRLVSITSMQATFIGATPVGLYSGFTVACCEKSAIICSKPHSSSGIQCVRQQEWKCCATKFFVQKIISYKSFGGNQWSS